MIPNNPKLTIEDVTLDTALYVDPPTVLPHENIYGLCVGGLNIDDLINRAQFTNWYTTPIGTGNNLDTVFKVYRFVDELWEHIIDYDVVFSDYSLVSNVKAAFNRNNSLMIGFQDELGVGLCWTDPRTGNRQTVQITGARNPVVVLDALYDVRNPNGEVVLAYVNSVGSVCLRWESEFFEIEYDTLVDMTDYELVQGAMTKNTRQLQLNALQIETP